MLSVAKNLLFEASIFIVEILRYAQNDNLEQLIWKWNKSIGSLSAAATLA